MKKISLLLFLVSLSLLPFAQVKKIPNPVVDKRVELLSIVFRLAGNREYNSQDNVQYVQKIHAHFDKYKYDPLIAYARQLSDSSGIGYDAVMAMAISLRQVPSLEPIIPFSIKTPDNRWSADDASKFSQLLRDFYKNADCKSFFRSCEKDYATAEKQFNVLFKKLDVNWYYKYYGKAPNETFNIIIGLGNGGNNYGPHIDMPSGQKQVYAIIGAGTFDSTGKPTFESDYYLPTLIHEFNHSFINYLTDKYEKSFSSPGKIIFENEKSKMKRQAYSNWKTMLNEALVRASVVRYLMSHEQDSSIADKEIKQQLSRGFVWMTDLVKLLGEYEAERNVYPTLESFVPRLVQFYDSVAPKIDFYDEDYLQHCAKLVSIQPFNDGDTSVDPAITEIRFNFDKKLDGIRYFFGPTKKGMDHYPMPVKFTFINNNNTILLKTKLKPDTEYEINMIGRMMRTEDGYAVQDHVIHFKTKKE
jgi:hypothetical protein